MTQKPKRGRPFGLYKYPPFEREQRLAYYRMKSQAKYRGELFELEFEQFCTLWQGLWHRRGRTPDSVCMTREDPEESWNASNVKIIERRFHNQQTGENIRNNPGYAKFNIWELPDEDV